MRYPKSVLFILLIAISVTILTRFMDSTLSIDSYWSAAHNTRRTPSQNKMVETLPYIRSYFIYDHFDHSLRYNNTYTISFQNLDIKTSEQIKEILDQALKTSTLKYVSKEIALRQFSKIIKQELEKALNEIGKLNIPQNSSARITLFITPQLIKNIQYQENLEGKYLLDFSDTVSLLSNKIKLKNKVGHQKSKSLHLLNSVPRNGEDYQYFGGEISLLIDLSKKPKLSKIMFRKYLKINQHQKLRVPSSEKEIKIISSNFKKLLKNNNSFITLDIVHNLVWPTKNKSLVKFTFGDLLSISPSQKTFKTGEYIFHLDFNHPASNYPIKFKVEVNSLSFDSRTSLVNIDQSIIKIKEVKKYQLNPHYNMLDVKKDLKRKLLLSLGRNFLDYSSLKQFTSNLEVSL